MSSNHKLTTVIKGRTISGTQNQVGKMTLTFTDGSTMTVKTAGSSHSAMTGGTVEGVRQQGTELQIDFVGGSTLALQTEEAASCVMVRDKNHALEYTD